MDKKKVLKIILMILLIVLVIFVIHTLRNYTIVRKLQGKASIYVNSENFHIKSVANESNGIIVTMNYYQKDNKSVAIIEKNENGKTSKMSMYNNGERKDIFYDNSEEKRAELGTEGEMIINLINYLETDNNWQTLLGSIFMKAKKVEYDGKKCYVIENFLSPMFLNGTEKNEVYIEAETGLYLKSVMDEIITEREYEFDKVEDKIFIEPNIGEYKLNYK